MPQAARWTLLLLSVALMAQGKSDLFPGRLLYEVDVVDLDAWGEIWISLESEVLERCAIYARMCSLHSSQWVCCIGFP